MADNPSLVSTLPDGLNRAYGNAVLTAGAETDLPDSLFPPGCPWTFAQIMDQAFWPGG